MPSSRSPARISTAPTPRSTIRFAASASRSSAEAVRMSLDMWLETTAIEEGDPKALRAARRGSCLRLLADGLELVADAVACLDEGVLRLEGVDLVAQLADEHVHSAVAMRLAAAPDLLQDLVPGDDAAAVEREGVKETELRRSQLGAPSVHVRLHVERVDPQLGDLDRIAAVLVLDTDSPPGGRAHPGHELLHGKRLDEIVVGADLERVHPVVLGAARADDDDRG